MKKTSPLIKAMRLIIYVLGFVSIFLVMFMAQRLEQRLNNLEKRWLEITKETIPSSSGGRNKTLGILQKAQDFIERTAYQEKILNSMEEDRRAETDLAIGGTSINTKTFMLLDTNGRMIPFQNMLSGLNQTIASILTQRVWKTNEQNSRENFFRFSMKFTESQGKSDADSHGVNDFDDEAIDLEMTKIENEEATDEAPGDHQPHIFALRHPPKQFNKDGTPTKDNILVVIISNRRDGVIPTVGSIIATASRPVDLILIGEHEINEQVRDHFGDRLNDFTSMSVKDVENDLVAQGYSPIWTWPEWHTSMNPSWKNDNTIHVGSWDNLMTHAHVLNHIRFYLPLSSIFKNRSYFYFLDDDILVQRDLGILAELTMKELPPERGLVCACNIWMWNSECFHFEFQSKKDFILSMPSLYGDREVCKTEFETHCVPDNYWDWVKSVTPPGGEDQHAWNFGFSLFGIDHWVNNDLTAKYEMVMKASYDKHVFPETSLTFGLGVAYIAFAGAVECWNEEHVKVRDGFGFIEWDRYAKTFGDDFFDYVDVVHYTGPTKPWVKFARIEQRAIIPWLQMMKIEKMEIPEQLPQEPTHNLITLLAGDRAGAQWVMNVLDSHPEVCASGEADKPEIGFSADVVLPSGLPWYPYCSIKRACSLEFYKTNVHKVLEDTNSQGVPMRCLPTYDRLKSNDELLEHLDRVCNIVQRLGGNYTDGNIARVWVDGFISEDRDITGCGCVRGVQAKVLKVLSEWITYRGYPGEMVEPPLIDLNATKVVGSKIIRLKRKNTWARYKSMMMAIQTEMFHPKSFGEKKDQLGLLSNMTIDVHHMVWNIKNFQEVDRAGDEWAEHHGISTLWLDYEFCRLNTADCFAMVYEFIGVDPSHVTGKHRSVYESTFAEMNAKDSTLDFVTNRGEIKEVLGANGWGHMISGEMYTPVQIMMYHTDEMFIRTMQSTGLNITLYGNDPKAPGFGNRFLAAVPYLQDLDPEALVVLCGDRDCWTNFPVNEKTYDSIRIFRENFENVAAVANVGMGGPTIVSSAEVECCPTTLTHLEPGDLFDSNGRRTYHKEACASGSNHCLWNSDENAEKWKRFMTDLAMKRNMGHTQRFFLDGSVLVGKAKDFLQFIQQLGFQPRQGGVIEEEDDRAILTDYMYRNPQHLVLDYEQLLVGQAREGLNFQRNPNCPAWHHQTNAAAISHSRSLDFLSSVSPDKRPLIVFSPRYHGCDGLKKAVPDAYPTWGPNGIAFPALMNHINRVMEAEESIVLLPEYGRVPDYRQGPEVPYVIDSEGLSTSSTIRSRTDEATLIWRLSPTETNYFVALDMLSKEYGGDSESVKRWPALWNSISKGPGFFFWAWYGDYKSCNYKNREEDSIPLFTTCASRFCDHSFPIPNYMNIIDTQVSSENWRGVFREFENIYPWSSKISKIIWRGALSEAEWRDALTSVRWRANKAITNYNLMGSTLYDVGLTGIPRWLTTRVKFNVTEVGGFLPGLKPMTSFMNYKAILDMDGNSWSSRFGTLLCYNSVVVKIEPKYFEYFYPELKPWKHFVPVANDLSDLDTNVRWVLDPNNEQAVKDIIESANDWCSRRILPEELARDQLDIWESYVRQLNRGDPKWHDQLKTVKDDLYKRRDFNYTNLSHLKRLKEHEDTHY